MLLALIQQRASADKVANVQRGLEAVRRATDQGATLVTFAELAFERFHPQRRASANFLNLAEPIPGPTTEKFQQLAQELGVVVVINLFEREGDRAFDTSPIIDADGTLLGRTRMIHITDYDLFYEKGYYTPGDVGAPVFDTRVGRLGVAICYDRHYPEVMRALGVAKADLVLIPQAGSVGEWPDGLYEAEVQVAAFQNGYYAALCNRVGVEEDLTFAGESFVCSPDGSVLARAGQGTDEILIAEIDLANCAKSHARQLFLPDRRPDLYSSWIESGSGCQ